MGQEKILKLQKEMHKADFMLTYEKPIHKICKVSFKEVLFWNILGRRSPIWLSADADAAAICKN
jgi:hypothetical protein